jgi:hypothetical protein
MRQIQRTMAVMLSVLAAACGGEAIGSAEPTVRDSAGVRIVENAQAPLGEWHLGTSPLFTLGWGSEDPKLTWVQSGRVLPDGGALVADFGDKSIFRVGPDGSIVATWGREGEGPGEYQGLDAMLLRGDSVLVSDRRLMRVTLLSLDGEVLATRPLPGAVLHEVSSVLADGRILLIPGNAYSYVTEMRQEWVFERQPIIAAALDAVTVDTLVQLPHLRRWYGSRGASPGAVSVRGRAGGFADGFAWSRADQPEVRWYDGRGRLVQIARWNEVPVALTPEWRTRLARNYEEAIRSRNADEKFVAARLAEFEEGLDRHEGPLPYWDSFLVDRQGNAWLREYSLPGEPSARWRVITRDGTFVGWIDVPNVASILDITSDRVLAVRLDEFDVSAVVMFQLSRR